MVPFATLHDRSAYRLSVSDKKSKTNCITRISESRKMGVLLLVLEDAHANRD